MKKTEEKVTSRWDGLDISSDLDASKNSFIKTDNDEGIFSNTRNDKSNNFRGPRRGAFIRYSKPVTPPPPKPFNLNEMEADFPILGS